MCVCVCVCLCIRACVCMCDMCVHMYAGDTTCGQRAVYQLGMTGIPIYNVSLTLKAFIQKVYLT